MAEKPTDSAGQAAEAETQETVLGRILALADQLEAQVQRQVAAVAGETPPPAPSLLSCLTPRMLACLVAAVGMTSTVAVVSPQQLPVAGYKLALMLIAGVVGYWLDRWAFPYARPDSFLAASDWRAETGAVQGQANHAIAPGCELPYAAAMLRRAAIMLGAMLAMGLGL